MSEEYMNDLEFVQKIIPVLSDEELSRVLKCSSAKGVVIPGFSKSPEKAPRKKVITSLKQKIKRRNYYELILEVLYELADNEFQSNQNFNYIRHWREDNSQHNNILFELENLIKNRQTDNLKQENQIERNIDINQENIRLQEENFRLTEKNNELQERNKKLQSSLQKKKIEIDNLNKSIQKIQRDHSKQKDELDSLKQNIERLNTNEVMLKEEILIKENCIKEFEKKIEELGKYRECAPKILCFIKKKEELFFEGYDITFISNWCIEVKENIKDNTYSEIWYVHKGFQYSDFIDIKEMFTCKILEFSNVQQLIQ